MLFKLQYLSNINILIIFTSFLWNGWKTFYKTSDQLMNARCSLDGSDSCQLGAQIMGFICIIVDLTT